MTSFKPSAQSAWTLLAYADERLGFSNLVRNTSNRILMYHSVGGGFWDDISPTRLRADVAYLTETYDVVDLPAVCDTGSPSKRIALTFDDGYRDFYNNVLPVVREFGVPVTVFVIAKTLDDPEFVHDDAADYEYMTSEQLLELVDEDLVTIGNHTLTHPDLTTIDSTDVLKDEIIGGKKQIEAKLGISVDRFAYPYNRFDERNAELVRTSHSIGVSGSAGMEFISAHTDPSRLPRLNGSVPAPRLRWQLTDVSTHIATLYDMITCAGATYQS